MRVRGVIISHDRSILFIRLRPNRKGLFSKKSEKWCMLLADAMMFQRFVLLLAGAGLVVGFQAPIRARHSPRTLRVMSSTNHEAGSTTTTPTVAKAGSEELFDWNKQWYPVLSLKDTDPGRAHAVQVM